jgi:hypothetical protein
LRAGDTDIRADGEAAVSEAQALYSSPLSPPCSVVASRWCQRNRGARIVASELVPPMHCAVHTPPLLTRCRSADSWMAGQAEGGPFSAVACFNNAATFLQAKPRGGLRRASFKPGVSGNPRSRLKSLQTIEAKRLRADVKAHARERLRKRTKRLPGPQDRRGDCSSPPRGWSKPTNRSRRT